MAGGLRPFVAVNFAVTADGKISTRKRTPSDFSSKKDKRRLLEIRSTADAILVGVGTLSADQMTMGLPDADLRTERTARGQTPYPARVVVTNSGCLNPRWKLFTKSFSPILIFSTERMPEKTRQALKPLAKLYISSRKQLDLRWMLLILRNKHKIKRIVCEGGGELFRTLAVAGMVDEIHLTVTPWVFGGADAITLTGPAGDYLPKSLKCHLKDFEAVDGECFLRYRVTR